MVVLVKTADRVKLSALAAHLAAAGIESEVFDAAAGGLWGAAIPVRLVIDDADADTARRILREAGFREAADGDWDLA